MVDSSKVREVFSAVRMIAELAPVPLPEIFNLPPPLPEDCDVPPDQTACDLAGPGVEPALWTPYGIVCAIARQRGLFCQRSGEPDTHAAGLILLRATADGLLGLCFAPPKVV